MLSFCSFIIVIDTIVVAIVYVTNYVRARRRSRELKLKTKSRIFVLSAARPLQTTAVAFFVENRKTCGISSLLRYRWLYRLYDITFGAHPSNYSIYPDPKINRLVVIRHPTIPTQKATARAKTPPKIRTTFSLAVFRD